MKPSEVVVGDRIRKEMGNIDELTNSISELGLIEPIVIGRDNKLIAGERRLRAITRLGWDLVHNIHFIYNDEMDPLRRMAMEVEENVKRKELSWPEQVLGKKRLLEIQQQIYGVARAGNPSGGNQGFGINKLAAMLGESNAQTSKDIELAEFILVAPQLALAETKEAARRQATLAVVVATGLANQVKMPAPEKEQKWTLYEGDFNKLAGNIPDASIDLVIVDPPYGEDAQGMGPNSRPLIAGSFGDSELETRDVITQLAYHAYRTLRNNSFFVCFFGFTVYSHLCDEARRCGFEVDITPLVWIKNTVINTSPYTRYGRSYEPILIARKGEPKLLRPSQRDVIDLQNVITRGTNEVKTYHAQKPVALIEKFILDMTIPGATVVDFCCGSGTTGVAALQSGRRVILFEKDGIACQITRSRLAGF